MSTTKKATVIIAPKHLTQDAWYNILQDHVNRKTTTVQARKDVQDAISAQNLFGLLLNEEELVPAIIRTLVYAPDEQLLEFFKPYTHLMPPTKVLLLMSKLKHVSQELAQFLMPPMMKNLFLPNLTAEKRKCMLKVVRKCTSCLVDAEMVNDLFTKLNTLIGMHDDAMEHVIGIYGQVLNEFANSFFQHEWLDYMVQWLPLVKLADMKYFADTIQSCIDKNLITSTTPQLPSIQQALFSATIQSREMYENTALAWECMFDFNITIPTDMETMLVDKAFDFGIQYNLQDAEDSFTEPTKQVASVSLISTMSSASLQNPNFKSQVEKLYNNSLKQLRNIREFQLVCALTNRISTGMHATDVAALLLEKVTSTYSNEKNAIRYEEAIIQLVKRSGLPKDDAVLAAFMNLTLRVLYSLKGLKLEIFMAWRKWKHDIIDHLPRCIAAALKVPDTKAFMFVNRLRESPIVATRLAEYVITECINVLETNLVPNSEQESDTTNETLAVLIQTIGGYGMYAPNALWENLIPKATSICFSKLGFEEFDEITFSAAAEAIRNLCCANVSFALITIHIIEPFIKLVLPHLKTYMLDKMVTVSISKIVLACFCFAPFQMEPHIEHIKTEMYSYLSTVHHYPRRTYPGVHVLVSAMCNQKVVTLDEIQQANIHYMDAMTKDTIIAYAYCATRFPLEYTTKLVELIQKQLLNQADQRVEGYILQQAVCHAIKMQPDLVLQHVTIDWMNLLHPIQQQNNLTHCAMWNTFLAYGSIKQKLPKWNIDAQDQAMFNYFARCLSLFSTPPRNLCDTQIVFK